MTALDQPDVFPSQSKEEGKSGRKVIWGSMVVESKYPTRSGRQEPKRSSNNFHQNRGGQKWLDVDPLPLELEMSVISRMTKDAES